MTSEKDDGYKASGTLAGTRLRTELRDVAASVSVVTKEFMRDIGANNLDELLTYTLGTEVSGLTGNFSNPGQDANFTDLFGQIRSAQTSNRVRGVGGADQTRDYFITGIPLDGYNTDRVEINRGPNAMLFGLGSAAGIINNGLIKALPNRNKTKVETQFGQYGTYRGTLDHNQALIPDRFALRIATLFGEKKYRIEPNYLRDERIFLTATARPWKTGTLRVNTEYAKQFSNKAYNSPPTDAFSWWWALGKPVYDPTTGVGQYLGAPPSDVNLRVFNATGGITGSLISSLTRQPLLVLENPNIARLGITGLDPSIQAIEGSNTRVRLNSMGTAFANDSMRILANPKAYLQALNLATNPALANFWKDIKLTDPSIFDFYHESLEGPNRREWAFWKTYNAAFEQRLGPHAGFEVAFDKQFLDAAYVQPNQFRNHLITVDINTKLPNGAPIPNLGRPVVYGVEGFQSQSYPDLAGVGVTAGENRVGATAPEKEAWLARSYGQGVLDVLAEQPERRVLFVHRQHEAGAAEIARHFGPVMNHPRVDFIYSFKYAAAHALAVTRPRFHEKFLPDLGGRERMWTLRNDGVYHFLWYAPDFVRDFVRGLPAGPTRGFCYGSDGHVWGRDFLAARRPEDAPRPLELEKHAWHWRLWGRLGYEPDLDNTRLAAPQRASPDPARQKLLEQELNRAAQSWRLYGATAVTQYRNPLWTNRVGHVDWRKAYYSVLYDLTSVGATPAVPAIAPTPGGTILEAEDAVAGEPQQPLRTEAAGYAGRGYLEFAHTPDPRRIVWNYDAPAHRQTIGQT